MKLVFKKGFLSCTLCGLWLGVVGCSLPRNPVPLARMTDAEIKGFPGVRSLEIEYKPSFAPGTFESSDCSFLVLSGGGANGAFGAGFLNGWTESGTRPNFRVVTGVSTGALIAPLAFLGPKYDERLKTGYTTVSTKDILDISGIFQLLWGESYADAKPFEEMIEWQMNEEILAEIAAEHAIGRRLYIGTTNLDTQRFIVWDMGAIASTARPDTLKLFRKVLQASASIPGVFPPVLFDVEVDGKPYDEMHVDGGVIAGMFGYGNLLFQDPPTAERLSTEHCSVYIIRNGQFVPASAQVPRKVTSIAPRSLSTLMKAHSWMGMFRLHAIAENDGVDFNYVGIPNDYQAGGAEPFDREEMNRLFNLGFEMARPGYSWRKTWPGSSDENDGVWTL